MDDLVYIAITLLFFVLTWGLLKMCEVLQPTIETKNGQKPGGVQ